MRSKRTEEFNKTLRGLPADVRSQAEAAYRMFARDPFHPGLQFKRIAGSENLWSARVGLHYRVIGRREGDLVSWGWIGSHSEYDRRLGG